MKADCAPPSVAKRYHFSFLHTPTPIQAGGSGRSLGTATNEDAHLIWWSRLGRQSVYLLQWWTLPVDHPSFRLFRQNPVSHGCWEKYSFPTFQFAVITHDWNRPAVSYMDTCTHQTSVWENTLGFAAFTLKSWRTCCQDLLQRSIEKDGPKSLMERNFGLTCLRRCICKDLLFRCFQKAAWSEKPVAYTSWKGVR